MFHKNIPAADNHIAHCWAVADAAARDALSVASSDQYKLCLQLDSFSLWILTNHSPKTWAQVGGGVGTGSVNDASDVTLTGLQVGDILQYNGTAFVNVTGNLNNLTDVTITSPQVDHMLRYNGSQWINERSPSNFEAAFLLMGVG